MTNESQADFDPEFLLDDSWIDLSHISEPVMNLKVAMLFPSEATDIQHDEQYKRIFDIQQRGPRFVQTQNTRNSHRALIGAKSPPHEPDAKNDKWHEIRDSTESKLFDLPTLVTTFDDLPPIPYKNEISSRTIDGVLAGSMLMYMHTLASSTFKTESGRTATGSENIAAFLCEMHNLGRPRRIAGRPRLDSEDTYPAITEDLTKSSWKKFQSVCHLWAAFIHLVGFNRDLSIVHLKDIKDWKPVLVLAKQYETFAANFFIPRTATEQRLTLVPVNNFGFLDIVTIYKKLSILNKPKGVLDFLNTWVCKYNTKHK